MKRYLLTALLMLSAFSLSAQRTSDRQFFATAQSGYPITARVGVGQYLLKSFWDAYASANFQSADLSSGDILHYMPVRAGGRFMYRLTSTRSRSFSLYGGGGAFVGAEILDYTNSIPETIDLGLESKDCFIFGITANVEVEFYLGKRVSIVAGANAPLTFLSNIARLHNGTVSDGSDNSTNGSVSFKAEGHLGLRFTLN